MKMDKPLKIIVFFTFILITISCNDIINTDPNLQKDLVFKKLSSEDSLKFLIPQELDFGSLKVRSVGTGFVSIVNNSNDKIISIYKIEQQNQTGLFSYTLKNSLPIQIYPGEDILNNESIKVKFIADAFTLGMYYDTLFLNGSRNIYVPIKAIIRY
jgi:hypothetical protein